MGAWRVLLHYKAFNKAFGPLLRKSTSGPLHQTENFCAQTQTASLTLGLFMDNANYPTKNFPFPAVDQLFCLTASIQITICEHTDLWLNFSFVSRALGTKKTQPSETTEGTHSPGIWWDPPTMRSFCSKRKFHCPSAARRCVMLRTWILGGSFDLWRSWCYSGAKAALSVLWDRPAVVTSNTPNFSDWNTSLSFTSATCSVWIWGGTGCGVGEGLEGVHSVVTQGYKLKESACISAFASRGRAELVSHWHFFNFLFYIGV